MVPQKVNTAVLNVMASLRAGSALAESRLTDRK
jgi:hypothetical protein